MIPQHSGAPHRQQRFIELKNVGAVVIPPFAALEVVESERPENSVGKTPGGGRTVLQVQRASTDDVKVAVINGPCSIPVGGYGHVGTMDSPMLALVASAYSNGDDVGLVSGSFTLNTASEHPQYRVIGDYDGASGTQRVQWQPAASADSEKLQELCSLETAERNKPYKCLKGTWSAGVIRWCYDDKEDEVWAIDHRMGAPHAEADWKGLYQKMPANYEHVIDSYTTETITEIWVCVSLDCEVPPEGCECTDPA